MDSFMQVALPFPLPSTKDKKNQKTFAELGVLLTLAN